MTDSDTAFLTALGHRIVASPAAYALIDDETLLFAVHLYRPIYAAALQSCLPAIFVGTGWDVWDSYVFFLSSLRSTWGVLNSLNLLASLSRRATTKQDRRANVNTQGDNRRRA